MLALLYKIKDMAKTKKEVVAEATSEVVEKKSKATFEVVSGTEVVQGTFKTLEEAESFAKETGFKVKV